MSMGLRNKERYSFTNHFLAQVSKRYPQFTQEEFLRYLENLKDNATFSGISQHKVTRHVIHVYKDEKDVLLVDPKRYKMITMYPYRQVKILDKPSEYDLEQEVQEVLEQYNLNDEKEWAALVENIKEQDEKNWVLGKEAADTLRKEYFANEIPFEIQQEIYKQLMDIAQRQLLKEVNRVVEDLTSKVTIQKEGLPHLEEQGVFKDLVSEVTQIGDLMNNGYTQIKDALKVYQNILEHNKLDFKTLQKHSEEQEQVEDTTVISED